MIIINNNTQKSGGVTPEEVITASQGYPYNVTIGEIPVKNEVFEGDLLVSYDFSQATDTRLFAEGSFLANHVQKVNIMGFDVEDMASLPSILTMIRDTYDSNFNFSVKFTLDTDTIEGDLFGINYIEDGGESPKPIFIIINYKVKSLDCSHIDDSPSVSMLNSPTEILEQGSIKGNFTNIVLPLALKNLEENAFTNCSVGSLIMPSLTVPESLPQSLSITNNVYFPALFGERTYKDYVADVFNIDVTKEEGAAKVLCFDVATGALVRFKQEDQN